MSCNSVVTSGTVPNIVIPGTRMVYCNCWPWFVVNLNTVIQLNLYTQYQIMQVLRYKILCTDNYSAQRSQETIMHGTAAGSITAWPNMDTKYCLINPMHGTMLYVSTWFVFAHTTGHVQEFITTWHQTSIHMLINNTVSSKHNYMHDN